MYLAVIKRTESCLTPARWQRPYTRPCVISLRAADAHLNDRLFINTSQSYFLESS
jgi:hypothetical protein